MGTGQKFLTWLGSGLPHLNLKNIPQKSLIFFPSDQKNLIGLGQKIPESCSREVSPLFTVCQKYAQVD